MIRRTLATAVALACVATACASGAEDNAARDVDPSVVSSTTAQSETSQAIESSSTTSPEAITEPNDVPPLGCVRLTDFETEEGRGRWQVVNDDVMGGQSEGGLSFVEGSLVFEGTINTDGGGFSSIRLPIEIGSLGDRASIMISATSDGRSYMATLEDQADGRNPRVSHRATIEASSPGQPSVATIPFGSFAPAIFGQPVDDSPVQAGTIDELGLMISDGADGPFRLEVTWIAGCP